MALLGRFFSNEIEKKIPLHQNGQVSTGALWFVQRNIFCLLGLINFFFFLVKNTFVKCQKFILYKNHRKKAVWTQATPQHLSNN